MNVLEHFVTRVELARLAESQAFAVWLAAAHATAEQRNALWALFIAARRETERRCVVLRDEQEHREEMRA